MFGQCWCQLNWKHCGWYSCSWWKFRGTLCSLRESIKKAYFFNDKNERIPQLYILVCLHIYFNTRVAFCLHFFSLMCIINCNPACQWLCRAHRSPNPYHFNYWYYYGNLILLANTSLFQNSKMDRCYFVFTILWLTELIKQLKNSNATFRRFISMYKVYASY